MSQEPLILAIQDRTRKFTNESTWETWLPQRCWISPSHSTTRGLTQKTFPSPYQEHSARTPTQEDGLLVCGGTCSHRPRSPGNLRAGVHVPATLTWQLGLLELVPGSGPCKDNQDNRWHHVKDTQSTSTDTYRVKKMFLKWWNDYQVIKLILIQWNKSVCCISWFDVIGRLQINFVVFLPKMLIWIIDESRFWNNLKTLKICQCTNATCTVTLSGLNEVFWSNDQLKCWQ